MNGKQLMHRAICKSNLFVKRNSSTILSCIGVAGVVATTIMAVKATPKAIRLLEEAKSEKGEELTKIEVIKIVGPSYVPTAIVGVSTIACIVGANVLNKQRQAALASAYALLDQAYKGYRNKIKETLGEDTDTQVRDAMVKDKYEKIEVPIYLSPDKCLFYDEIGNRYFESTTEAVLSAEYHLNRNFTLRGYADLNEFYDFLGIDKTPIGDVLGWNIDMGLEFYGYSWVDFDHRKITMDDGLECYIIHMPFAPTADYNGEYEE